MQLALCGMAEFVFHLSRLDSDVFQIAIKNGQLTQTFYVFDINQQGQSWVSEQGAVDRVDGFKV